MSKQKIRHILSSGKSTERDIDRIMCMYSTVHAGKLGETVQKGYILSMKGPDGHRFYDRSFAAL